MEKEIINIWNSISKTDYDLLADKQKFAFKLVWQKAQKEYIKKHIKSIEEELNPRYGEMLEMLHNLKADLRKLENGEIL